jgi:hypothetical protein
LGQPVSAARIICSQYSYCTILYFILEYWSLGSFAVLAFDCSVDCGAGANQAIGPCLAFLRIPMQILFLKKNLKIKSIKKYEVHTVQCSTGSLCAGRASTARMV